MAREADRVVNEVGEDLLYAPAVRTDGNACALTRLEPHACLLGLVAEPRHRRLHEVIDGDIFDLHAHGARLDLTEVDQIVDEDAHAVRLLVDQFAGLTRVDDALDEGLREALDRGERGLQFV